MANVTQPLMLNSTGVGIMNALNALNQAMGGIQPDNCAANHNGVYRGRDLTNIYSLDDICNMIHDGKFSDLFVGDYFKKSITYHDTYTDTDKTEDVDFQIAGFNCYKNVGDSALTKNHAVIVTKDCLTDLRQMHETDNHQYQAGGANTTEGGYTGSDLYKHYLCEPFTVKEPNPEGEGQIDVSYSGTLAQAIKTAFTTGEGCKAITRRVLLSNAMNSAAANQLPGSTGAASNWAWVNETVGLMSEVELYGASICSSSLYDIGEACMQLPLFALNPAARIAGKGRGGARYWYWLRGVASATYFAYCGGAGNASYGNASYPSGVRLRFLIG